MKLGLQGNHCEPYVLYVYEFVYVLQTPSSGLQGGAPSVGSLQSQAHQQNTLHQAQAHQNLRHKVSVFVSRRRRF